MNKKVIELIRVSTEGQAAEDRAGIPAQREINRRTARAYGLEITHKRGKTKVKEVWSNDKIKPSHANAVRVGKHVYTSISSGMSGPSFLVAVDLADGKIAWQERGFSLSKLISADGKLIVLDEDGKLGLIEASPEKLEILSEVNLLEKTSWTPPTLVGTRLFVRDQKTIAALELKN